MENKTITTTTTTFLNQMNDFFSGFRSCKAKSREFYYNFEKLGLKQVDDKSQITTTHYFHARGFFWGAGGNMTYNHYYEADSNSIQEYHKMNNCIGQKLGHGGRHDIDSVDIIELIKLI